MHLKRIAGHHCYSGLGIVVYLRVEYLEMHVDCPGLCSALGWHIVVYYHLYMPPYM